MSSRFPNHLPKFSNEELVFPRLEATAKLPSPTYYYWQSEDDRLKPAPEALLALRKCNCCTRKSCGCLKKSAVLFRSVWVWK